MNKKDQLLLAEVYTNTIFKQKACEEIVEENWKNKLIAAGVGAAGLAGLGSLGANYIVSQDKAEKESIHSTGVDLQTNQDFKDSNKLKTLIQNYFQLKGQSVEVNISGDNVNIGNKTISLKKLKMAVQEAKEEGYTANLPGYLAQNL